MKNKKIFVVGLGVLLVVGLVFATGTQVKSWHGHGAWKGGDHVSYNHGEHSYNHGEHSYNHRGDKSAWLEKLGLSSDATEDQISEAKKEHWGQRRANHREKLGLSDDASEEEVKVALKQWKEENGFHSKKNCEGYGFSEGA